MGKTPKPSRPAAKAPNDIYTVLASIAVVTVLGTIAFVIFRCTELFDTPLPGIDF